MRRTIITLLLTVGISGSVYAANESIKLDNNEYINKLNDSIGEMNLCISEEGDAFDLLFNIKKGYLSKTIESMDSKIENYSSLVDSMREFKIRNKDLQSKHNELMNYYEEISSDLKIINEKQKGLLDKDYNGFSTFKELLNIQEEHGDILNNKIDAANVIYQEIQDFYINESE